MKNLKFTLVRSLLFNLFIVSAVLLITYACSESDPESAPVSLQPYKCVSCKTQPDAKPEYDNSYKGIYVGVTSSGNLLIDLNNSSDMLSATMTIDGVKSIFSSESVVLLEKNIYHAFFHSNFNGELVSFEFRVNSDGTNPNIISAYFPELKRINKETSKSMLEVFEGTYTVKAGSILAVIPPEIKIIDSLGVTYIQGKYSMVINRSQTIIADPKTGTLSKGWWNGAVILNDKTYYHGGMINTTNQLIDGFNRYSGTLNADSLIGEKVYLDVYHTDALLRSKRIL